MSIASEITRITNNINSAYISVRTKGGTLPEVPNSANLATAISSIPGTEMETGIIALSDEQQSSITITFQNTHESMPKFFILQYADPEETYVEANTIFCFVYVYWPMMNNLNAVYGIPVNSNQTYFGNVAIYYLRSGSSTGTVSTQTIGLLHSIEEAPSPSASANVKKQYPQYYYDLSNDYAMTINLSELITSSTIKFDYGVPYKWTALW